MSLNTEAREILMQLKDSIYDCLHAGRPSGATLREMASKIDAILRKDDEEKKEAEAFLAEQARRPPTGPLKQF